MKRILLLILLTLITIPAITVIVIKVNNTIAPQIGENTYQIALDCDTTLTTAIIEFDVPDGYESNYKDGDIILELNKYGMYNLPIKLFNANDTINYLLKIWKPYNRDSCVLIVNKNNLVLIANNNDRTNGGYKFKHYEWYENNNFINFGQNYYASLYGEQTLNINSEYTAKLYTKNNELLTTCPIVPLTNMKSLSVFPNPLKNNEILHIEIDKIGFIKIDLYTINGIFINKYTSEIGKLDLQLNLPPGLYILKAYAPTINYYNNIYILIE